MCLGEFLTLILESNGGNMKSMLTLLILSSLFYVKSYGQIYIDTSQASYWGTGCTKDTMAILYSNYSNQNKIGLLFDDLILDLNSDSNVNEATKTCRISIPIQIPKGYSLSIDKPTFYGFIYLKGKSNANFEVKYNYGNSGFQKISKMFENVRGEYNTDYFFDETRSSDPQYRTPCNESVVLNILIKSVK